MPDVRIVITGFDKFSNILGKPLKALDKFGRKTAMVGKAMSRNLTLPIVGIGAAASIASVKMNEGMANVATLIPGNLARIKELKAGIMDLGIEVGKRSETMTKGLFQVVSAFGDNAETMEKLRINSRAATAGMATVEESINLTSAVTKAYGDVTLGTTQKVADLAFKANELGQTTFKEMAASIGKVTPLAANLGVKMEEMFGVIATGTGVTGDTAIVNTQLSAVLAALLKPTADMEIAFKTLGVSSGKELIQQKGLQGTMEALMGLTKKYDVTLGKLVGRKEAMSLVLALTGGQADEFTRKLTLMDNAAGAAETAFKEQTQGINKAGFQWKQFIATVEKLAIKIGDRLVPILSDLGKKYILPLLTKIGSLNDSQIKWALKIGVVIAALGPLLMIIGGVVSAVVGFGAVLQGLIFVIGGVGSALTFLAANPVGMIIMAIGLLTLGIIWLVKNWDLVVIGFKKGWAFILEHWKTGVQFILMWAFPFIGALVLIVKHFDKIKEGAKALGRIILPKGLEERLGLQKRGEEKPALSGQEVMKTWTERQTSRNEFAGTLRIVGATPKSEIEITKGGGMNIDMESGLHPAGVGL